MTIIIQCLRDNIDEERKSNYYWSEPYCTTYLLVSFMQMESDNKARLVFSHKWGDIIDAI